MPGIRLTDEELTHVFEAARPIPVNRRDDFLQEVRFFRVACIAPSRQARTRFDPPLDEPRSRVPAGSASAPGLDRVFEAGAVKPRLPRSMRRIPAREASPSAPSPLIRAPA